MRENYTAAEIIMRRMEVEPIFRAQMAAAMDALQRQVLGPIMMRTIDIIARADLSDRVQRLLNPYYGIEAWRR